MADALILATAKAYKAEIVTSDKHLQDNKETQYTLHMEQKASLDDTLIQWNHIWIANLIQGFLFLLLRY